jgi:diguanylate cyclase
MNMHEPPQSGTGSGAAGRPNAAETARRVLKTLAERKIIPTPETFSDVYHEVSGLKPGTGGSPAAVVKEVLKDLVRANRLAPQEALPIVERAQRNDWLAVRDAMDRALARRPGGAAGNWPQLALQLLKQADVLHANWTRARKIDAVTRVIEGATDQPDVALDRLSRLIESWGPALAAAQARPDKDPLAAPTQPAPAPAHEALPAGQAPVARYSADPKLRAELDAVRASADAARGEADAWKQVALRSMRLLEDSCGAGSPAALKLREFAKAHAGHPAPGAHEAVDGDRLLARFLDAVREIDRQIDEEHKVRVGLQRLLALLCDNMKALTPEEAWLAGQLEPIRALLAGTIRSAALDEAEAKLAQVITQQAAARRSLQEAKAALKEMLGTLVERIGAMSSSTGKFCDQVGTYQKQLESATDFGTLSQVIRGLLADTQTVRDEMLRSRTELAEAKRKVETYESRVLQLEKELTQVSALVQKDPLTFALNRRGLEEAFRMETARAMRYDAPLGFVILDLDDFKKLNDSLGHIAGDRALVHFSTLMQATVRPTDFMARIGGEEFALLLPATDVEESVKATERLQRELRKRGFQFEGQDWPVTFSAGATQWRRDEPLEELMQRADRALYDAKHTGKNRVVKA